MVSSNCTVASCAVSASRLSVDCIGDPLPGVTLDPLPVQAYTRRLSDLGSLGLKRSLVCFRLSSALLSFSLKSVCAGFSHAGFLPDSGQTFLEFMLSTSSFCWI